MSRRRNSTANINNITRFRNSLPLDALRDHEDKAFHAIYDELKATGEKLEHKCRDMQDTEFTIEEINGVPTLYFLQIRDGKRSAKAESVIAYNLVKEGIITKEEAICKVNPERFEGLLFPQIEPKTARPPRRSPRVPLLPPVLPVVKSASRRTKHLCDLG